MAGVFGVRGWIKVQSFTRPMDNLLSYPVWRLGEAEFTLVEGRPHGPGLVARLEGLDDRDAAAALVGRPIEVLRADLPPAGPGEYYWADLIGLAVVGEAGEALGRVTGMVETGAHDVLVLDVDGKERMIPFVTGPIVKVVDLDAGQITVAWSRDFW